MRVLWVAVILLFSGLGIAFADHVTVDCGGATLGTSYPGTPLLTGIAYKSHMKVINGSATRICWNTAAAGGGTPAADRTEHCVQPTSTESWDFIPVGGNLHARADGTSCSAAKVDFDAW